MKKSSFIRFFMTSHIYSKKNFDMVKPHIQLQMNGKISIKTLNAFYATPDYM